MRKIKNLTVLFVWFFLATSAFAQFKSQLPDRGLRSPVQSQKGESVISLEDQERLSISHGFSLNMASFGKQTLSYGIYSNRLKYLISDKWSLHTTLDLVQPTNSFSPVGMNALNGQVYYGADLLYQPTENLQLTISVDNYPRLNRYWPANRYSPYPRYHE